MTTRKARPSAMTTLGLSGAPSAAAPVPAPAAPPTDTDVPASAPAQPPRQAPTDTQEPGRASGRTGGRAGERGAARKRPGPQEGTPARAHARTRVREAPRDPAAALETRKRVDVEARRYASAARRLAEREDELARVVEAAMSAGASPQQVAVWISDVAGHVPPGLGGLLDA